MGIQLNKLLLNLTILLIHVIRSSTTISAQSLPGCPDKCGNVKIPYPFGTVEGCYLSKTFQVDCENLQIAKTSFKLESISLNGHMRGSLPIAYRCYDKYHNIISKLEPKINLSRFQVSDNWNLLTLVGCDARADIKTIEDEDYITGCITRTKCNMLYDSLCLGMGCSQVRVPYEIAEFRIRVQRNTNTTGRNWYFNKCVYAFLVERNSYAFRITDLDRDMKNRSLPVVLEWSVGNTTCEQAEKDGKNYVCKDNSICINFLTILAILPVFNKRSLGYRCKCAQGFRGNPYLLNGCQDINEREEANLNDCIYGCSNTKGSYNCSCLWGQRGDGRKSGTRCYYSRGSVFAGISMGIAASVVQTCIIYGGLKQRRIMKSREKFFKKNGGLILHKLLFASKQSSHMAKIFSARVLEKATNNFHKTNVIGQGGCGIVYKGTLDDKTMVAIKKSNSIHENQIEKFINEVIFLSKISHPNVVKLLGCCLETPTPLLVYEFITNKTVFQHLHEHEYISSLTFERRLNIATQTAEALAHIHSTTQIIHRDIKSSNILLTDDYTAKVSDFGISRSIPVDQTHLHTLVNGTLGYIDPEYFRSGILTEKSDVYSFGMVLVELLTGKKVFSHDGTESELGLATFFVSSLEKGLLIRVLDDRVKKDGLDDEHIQKMAKLAKQCVELEGKKRPHMQEVKEKLNELSQCYLIKGIDHQQQS